MAIKVLNRVKHKGKYFEKDSVISDMNKKDEQHLIDLGVAISLSSKEEDAKKNK